MYVKTPKSVTLRVYATQSQTNQKTLTSKIAGLEEKLNTSSSNSSLPPSADVFKNKKPKKKYHGSGKSKRKQGA